MFKLAANLTLLFQDSPFLKRIEHARAAGFHFVEFHNPHPYDQRLEELACAIERCGAQVIHFNLPCPDWDCGGRGIAARPDRVQEFRASVAQALAYAVRLHCRQINCQVGNRHAQFSLPMQMQALVDNLEYAAAELAKQDITLLLEPLNPITHPTYLLTTTRQAVELQDRVGAPNLMLQYDYYQMQRSEGELAQTVRTLLPRVGFIQVADNPGRHQPGTGEINFRFLLDDLAQLGYDRFVSLEYSGAGGPEEWFRWIDEYGLSQTLGSCEKRDNG